MAPKAIADDKSRVEDIDVNGLDDDLTKLSEDELLAITVKADAEIAYQREAKAEVQAEVDRRHIQKRLATFTDAEKAALGITLQPDSIETGEELGVPGATNGG